MLMKKKWEIKILINRYNDNDEQNEIGKILIGLKNISKEKKERCIEEVIMEMGKSIFA